MRIGALPLPARVSPRTSPATAYQRSMIYTAPLAPIRLPKPSGVDPISLRPSNPLATALAQRERVVLPPIELHDLAPGRPGAPPPVASPPAGVPSVYPSNNLPNLAPPMAQPLPPAYSADVVPPIAPMMPIYAGSSAAMPAPVSAPVPLLTIDDGTKPDNTMRNVAIGVGAVLAIGLAVALLRR